jgi:hypothetical protein
MSEVRERLLKVQSELKAPKSQYNSFGKYNYRNQEDILEAVKPLLSKHELSMTISDEIVCVGERYYVKATVFISHKGEAVSVSAFAREEENKKGMDASQLTGATSSYARKYALNGMFLIDDTKDSDATNTHGKDSKSQSSTKELPAITKDRFDKALKAIASGDYTIEQLKSTFSLSKDQEEKLSSI